LDNRQIGLHLGCTAESPWILLYKNNIYIIIFIKFNVSWIKLRGYKLYSIRNSWCWYQTQYVRFKYINSLLVKSFTNTTIGVFSGVALSMFFTRKVRIIGYAAGIGFGFALH
jgi:hypothetical protein